VVGMTMSREHNGRQREVILVAIRDNVCGRGRVYHRRLPRCLTDDEVGEIVSEHRNDVDLHDLGLVVLNVS
jgi:hypothetical protein